jgi:hypothetical protein
MSSSYLQNGLFVEPQKAIILRQPRLSSELSLETVSLKLTNCCGLLFARSLSTTSAVISDFLGHLGNDVRGDTLCLAHG